MNHRSHLVSHQSKRFVERKKLRNLIIICLCLVIFGTGGFSLVRLIDLNAFDIQSVKVDGADSNISPTVQAAALDSIQGEYLGLLSKSSTLLYSAKAIKDSVLRSSPRIASVSVSRQGLQALVISVKEKAPAALVCANLPDFEGNALSFGDSDDCYFADDSGYLYGTAPSFSGDIYNRYYLPNLTDNASSSAVVGTFATSTGEFAVWQGIFADLKNASIAAQAMLVKGGGEYELYVNNPSQIGDAVGNTTASSAASSTDSDMAVIYLNDGSPLPEQISNLVSFWKQMADTASAKHQPLSFEYIDVRYGSNVFYRLNN